MKLVRTVAGLVPRRSSIEEVLERRKGSARQPQESLSEHQTQKESKEMSRACCASECNSKEIRGYGSNAANGALIFDTLAFLSMFPSSICSVFVGCCMTFTRTDRPRRRVRISCTPDWCCVGSLGDLLFYLGAPTGLQDLRSVTRAAWREKGCMRYCLVLSSRQVLTMRRRSPIMICAQQPSHNLSGAMLLTQVPVSGSDRECSAVLDGTNRASPVFFSLLLLPIPTRLGSINRPGSLFSTLS